MTQPPRPLTRVPVLPLVQAAWGYARRAVPEALHWLLALAVVAGTYRAVLASDVEAGLGAPLLLTMAFGVGVQLSLTIYRTMLGTLSGRFPHLMQANLAIYLAFMFLSVFVGFFLAILPGILLQASGRDDLGPDTSPEVWEAAIRDMLPTAYGAVFLGVMAIGALIMSFFALRLLLVGAATVARGETLVFRTWRWTGGHALRLGLAALLTHIVPFAMAVALSQLTDQMLGTSGIGGFFGGALGILYLAPFLLAGHGLAVAAYHRLAAAPEIAQKG